MRVTVRAKAPTLRSMLMPLSLRITSRFASSEPAMLSAS